MPSHGSRRLRHREVAKKKHVHIGFKTGYDVALLYHTMLAIGFDFLPYSERLFAIYSAGRLLDGLS